MSNHRTALKKNAHFSNKNKVYVFNDNDCHQEIVQWIWSGNYTRELFAKHLPHTAKDISQGRLHYHELNSLLQVIVIWHIEGDDTVRLRTLSVVIANVIAPKTAPAIVHETICGLAARMLYYKIHIKYERAACIDTEASLSNVLKGIRSAFLSETYIKEVDEAFIQSGLRSGSFLRLTCLNKSTESQFIDAIMAQVGDMDERALWEECEKMRRVANTFDYITADYDPTYYTCWECNQVVDSVSCCGRCKAALYCSRQCQVVAWKKGHRGKCVRLKAMNKEFVTGVDEMERAHVAGKIDGFVLSPATDIHMMLYCFCLTSMHSGSPRNSPIMKETIPSFPRGPCMKYYYENLGRIIRGEWWAYDPSKDRDEDDPLNFGNKDTPEGKEVLKRLTLDWFGAVDSDDPQDVTAYSDSFFRAFSARISPDALLQCYASGFKSRLDGFRPNFKLGAYQMLQQKYNEL